MYSKSANEIIRELNGLIVNTKETAEYIRLNSEPASESDVPYSKLWGYIADKADSMADRLTEAIDRITTLERGSDEITAMLMILKLVEYAVFQSDIIAFQGDL